MALRRVLPSRVQMPENAPEASSSAVSIVAPVVSQPAAVVASVSVPENSVPNVAKPVSVADKAAMAAVLDDVLEPTPFEIPAVDSPKMPSEPAQTEQPSQQVASTQPEKTESQPVAVPVEAETVAEAPQVLPSQPNAPSEPVAEPLPEAVAEPVTETIAEQVVVNENVEATRPDDNPLRRRPKKPRAYTFAPPVEEKPAENITSGEAEPVADDNTQKPSEQDDVEKAFPKPEELLVDSRPLDEVDDRLRASGVLQEEKDSLLSQVPPATAEASTTLGDVSADIQSEFRQITQPVVAAKAPEDERTKSEEQTLAEIRQQFASFAQQADQTKANSVPQPDPLPQSFGQPVLMKEPNDTPSATSVRMLNSQPVSKPEQRPQPKPFVAEEAPETNLPWGQTPVTLSSTETTAPANDWSGIWGGMAPSAEATPEAPASPAPTPDVYGGYSANGANVARTPLPPPEIIGQRQPRNSSNWQLIVAGVLVVGALGGAYYVLKGDKQPAMLANQNADNAQLAQNNIDGQLLPPPSGDAPVSPDVQLFDAQGNPVSGQTGTAVVNFADVPADQAAQPIVADGTEQMPDEVNFVARLQKAIADEKAKKGSATAETPDAALAGDTSLPAADGAAPSSDLKAQYAADLAAYRKALAQTPPGATKPTPDDFIQPHQEASPANDAQALDSEGAPVQTPNGELLPPPQLSGSSAVPPNELYSKNPKNLPIVPEPSAEQTDTIRQLSDFDVSMFNPESERVRIPQGVKPRFSSSDFPQMDVLSFVPGKGIIAFKDGKEGVLLIGETIDGWELAAVNGDNAEFRNGRRTRYITAE